MVTRESERAKLLVSCSQRHEHFIYGKLMSMSNTGNNEMLIWRVCSELAMNPDKKILVTCATKESADHILQQIKERMAKIGIGEYAVKVEP